MVEREAINLIIDIGISPTSFIRHISIQTYAKLPYVVIVDHCILSFVKTEGLQPARLHRSDSSRWRATSYQSRYSQKVDPERVFSRSQGASLLCTQYCCLFGAVKGRKKVLLPKSREIFNALVKLCQRCACMLCAYVSKISSHHKIVGTQQQQPFLSCPGLYEMTTRAARPKK